MSTRPSYKPDGYHTVTPLVSVRGAGRFIDFAVKAFGGENLGQITGPDGSVIHADLKIGDSIIMVGDAMGESAPMSSVLYIYTEDVDGSYRRALEAGATSHEAPVDQFWGDRTACVVDEFGNYWWLAARIEEVSMSELQRRSDAFATRAAGSS